MINISKKTLQDLEFESVIQQVASHNVTSLGKNEILATLPFSQREDVIQALRLTNEFVSSFDNENRIPNHGFDAITAELKLIRIENNYLEIDGFRKIASICVTTNILLKFFKKFHEYYPLLHKVSLQLEANKDIPEAIHSVVDKFGEIRNDASDTLYGLRKSIQSVRTKINTSFNSALSMYNSAEYLDDIRETVMENRRVLAVKAMHRRKVKGSILGSSKTGSIVYIEPDTTQQHQRDLNNLEFEETEEIKRILLELTSFISGYSPLLESYQKFLTKIDVIYAKAKYAKVIDAVLPEVTKHQEIDLVDAYHPLLLVANKSEGITTFPQTITMTTDSRIIVISGPNAGGKSITLKTVGLLQLMVQSGMLIPVYERSKLCLFDSILSDIGDNQSIENHLSTYSYRLKQMNYFLKKCNKHTLFLIDEFGTGSDPELGGALAETFLEVFYEREAFGIITTHYSNLKLLANELPHIQNANMLFDEKTLLPLYKLVIGQAGSSFTFEVAQKNGIPFSLINRSKKKIERGKIRFDKTIAKLQKERSKLEKTERALKQNEIKKSLEADKLETTNAKAKKKLQSYQELFDSNQRLVYLGQKISDLGERYFENNRKRELMSELFKLVQIENSKRQKITLKQKKAQKVKETELKKEVDQKVAVIRKEKKKQKEKAALIPPKPKRVLVVGDSVRLEDGRAVGTLDKLEKNKAVVNYGLFTTTVNIDRLEYVNSKK
ncbi:DNA mismatch repair protein MutS [Flavobacteriaceae bacterium]|nr:DNA mismatch repair protein MutS [Flavobacteriaceae bacterium]MDA7727683.1 DNA mismatch repair protein MutS [Flavobacteriaceae bacterium]MDB0004051.1 DNA mismatch repair protein MutS [Flavobacteriaceae bacterium]